MPKIVKPNGTNEYTSINCAFQDKAGNVWFSAPWGVYRYDGKLFTNITKEDGLFGDGARCYLEDKAGKIWFSTSEGIFRYDPEAAARGNQAFTHIPAPWASGSFYPPYVPADKNPSDKVQVNCMLQDKSGKIWVGTNTDGVYCYDGASFTHFLHNDGISNKEGLHLIQVTSMLQDKTGNIWFTTWFEGICRFDGKAITSIKPKGKVWFAAVLEDRKGNLWFGTRDYGAYRYDGKTFTSFEDIDVFSACCVCSIAEDKAGNIWFGTEASDMTRRETTGGVWSYDGRSFKNYIQKDGIKNCSAFSVLADRTGNIWAGTRNNGLYCYDPLMQGKGDKVFTSFTE